MIKNLFMLAALLLLPACGYQFAGEAHRLPGDVRQVRVALFENNTAEAFLDTLLTEKVTRRFMRLHNVELVEEQAEAEAELGGVITGYHFRAIAHDGNDQIEAYRLTLEVSARLTRRLDGKILWSNDLIRYHDFVTSNSDITGQETLETAAQADVAARLAEDISAQMASDFGVE